MNINELGRHDGTTKVQTRKGKINGKKKSLEQNLLQQYQQLGLEKGKGKLNACSW